MAFCAVILQRARRLRNLSAILCFGLTFGRLLGYPVFEVGPRTRTTENTMKRALVLVALSCISLAVTTQADLSIANGDFNSGITAPGVLEDIPDWYDYPTQGSFWNAPWVQWDGPQPIFSTGDTPVINLSWAGTSTWCWLYQNIGTRGAGDTAMDVSFELGAFTDGSIPSNGQVVVALYQSASFAGSDATDIATVAGVTQIDATKTVDTGPMNGATGDTVLKTVQFDLTSANLTDPLFLRLGSTGDPWLALDNIQLAVVPEPSTFVLAGLGLGVLAFLRRRD